ncbi:MAG: hypothetical protein DRJ47_10675 [Thermoprotei archaeon]|nr:MAG: hypothetical protein DRJ47_10675 [Thermoprotei archaeon]
MVKRIYVSDETYTRLRKYAANTGMKLREAIDRIVLEAIDSDGKYIEPSIRVSREVLDMLTTWANELGISVDELIRRMVLTISVLFDSRLTLADALKSLPELKRILDMKRGEA